MAEALAAKPTKFYIHMGIILLLMFGVGFLPPIDPVTPYGMRVLGIFLACIYAWTVGETVWPSILGLIILGISGENDVSTIMSGAYGNQTLLMVVFSLVFCYAIDISGVLEVIAKKILSMKFAQKGPWALALAFFITSCVTSILVLNSLPVVLLLWSIFYDVCNQVGVKPFSKYATLVMIGIVITSYAGAVVMPYQVFAIIGLGVLQTVTPDTTVNTFSYITTMLAINVALVPLLTVVFKLVCGKVEFQPVSIDAKDTVLTTRHKIVLCSIALLALLMILPSILPKELFITVILSKLGVLGAMALVPTILMMMTFKREQFVDIAQGMSHGVTWQLYFLLATALALGNAVTSETTGISVLLSNMVAPLLAGKGAFAVIAIIVALSVVITNCINNIVTISLLMPIMYTYVTAAGGNPLVCATLLILCCLQGVVMPAGSVLGALLHGNVKWLKPGMIYKYAPIGEVVLIICAIVVGIPVASAII